MKASKKRYDSKWKVTRIAVGDYALLTEISRRAGVSMAEALHKLITRQPEPKPEPAQIPMPAFQVIGKPAIQVAPVTVTAVNGAGAEHSAYLIEPKEVIYG